MRTFKNFCLPFMASLVLGFVSGNAHGSTIVNFSDLTVPESGYWNGPDPNGTATQDPYSDNLKVGKFTSGGVAFTNHVFNHRF